MEQTVKEMIEAFNEKQSEIKTAMEAKADFSVMEKLNNEAKDLYEKRVSTIEAAQIKQGEAMTKFIETGSQIAEKSLFDRINDTLVKSKDVIKAVRTGASKAANFNFDLTRKDILSANFINITGDAFRIEGIGQKPVRRTFMEALVSKSSQVGDSVRYVDQASIVRGADVIQGCAAYPATTDITWEEFSMPWTKIGDMIHICKDQLEDHEYVTAEVQNLLTTNVNLKVDQQMLSGTGLSGQLKGINAVASTFASAAPFTLGVVAPTVYDLIHVVAAQLMNASFGYFMPNYVLMNPLDVALMGMSKDLNGAYIVPPFVTENGMFIAGLTVIENSGIAQNTLLVGDFTRAKLYDRKQLFVEMSTENKDNFEKDFVTIKAGRRLALVVRNVDANAFVKVTDIAAAIAAITKP